MKKIFRHKNSLLFKLTTFGAGIVVMQSTLLMAVLILGGVLEETRLNAYENFNNRVEERKSYLELEMKNRWTNIDPFINQISLKLSEDYSSDQELLKSVSKDIVDMLRTTQTTGVYLILADDKSKESYPALHIRDYDPQTNNYSYSDLYMVVGPSEVAKELKAPLDRTWSYDFMLTNTNRDFFMKPYQIGFGQSDIRYDSKLMGYWSEPFKMSEKDLEVMTYSMPIFDSKNNFRGVIGVELTLNYLANMIPSTDIQEKDSLGYMILNREESDRDMEPKVTVGSFQKRLIDKEDGLSLIEKNEQFGLYEVDSYSGKEDIYASVEELKLYQPNTPFESEHWYIAGFAKEDNLLSHVQYIQKLLWFSFGVALALGTVGGAFFSYRASKPILELSEDFRSRKRDEKLKLRATGLFEVDELAKAMEESNNERIESASRLSRIIDLLDMPIGAFEIKSNSGTVFVTEKLPGILGLDSTDREAFQNKIREIMEHPEKDEEDVYRIEGMPVKWVKLNTTETETTVIGVAEDVTEEIEEKLEILKERDIDSLTKLLNRKAFKSYMESILDSTDLKATALVMFDLDNLKSVNDTYGHKWGDYYIVEGVNQLKNIADRDKMLLGRRSGDEFVLLLHGFNSKLEVRECMDMFYSRLKDLPLKFPDGAIRSLGISGGLVWIESWPGNYDELLHRADEALYESKSKRKGSWTEDM